MASDMKRVVQELRALRQQLDEMERAAREPIAVIGMAGRFPGADTLEAFWALLREGHDAITEIPSDRWNVDAYYDPDPAAAGKAYVRRRGGRLRGDQQRGLRAPAHPGGGSSADRHLRGHRQRVQLRERPPVLRAG